VLIRSGAVALVAALAVAGCSASSDDEPQTAASPTPTATASETPYLPVPSGVELTTPGSQLSVGDHAVVAYRPRQDEVGALDIRVTSLQKTSIDAFDAWQLKPAQRKSNPYYVRATIENVGDTDLGGRSVPLYVVNEQNVLLEATPFASSFEPCPSTPFPERFKPGDRTRACLVYLAPNHGDLVSVSFRPEETFNPITWSGEIERYQPPNPTNPKNPGKPGKPGDSKKQNDR
jgi:hypothetical protein